VSATDKILADDLSELFGRRVDLEVLHTTATEQLPAFTADLRRVLSGITDRA
jgi:hypothetical protein